MTSQPATGAIATESSFLSKKVPANILVLQCLDFLENKKVVYQTLPGSKFYLKSTRMAEPVAANESRVTYSIEFDKSIVKHGLGFGLPTFMISMVARTDMKKYLQKLKGILEEQAMSN